MIDKIINFLNDMSRIIAAIVLNWSFIFGALTAICVLSNYIFGPNNLYEEAIEWLHLQVTGHDVDLTPHVPERQ